VRAVPTTAGVALNADYPARRRDGARRQGPRRHLGRAATAQVRLVCDVVEDARGLRVQLEAADALQPVTLAFAGRHNAINALAAAAVGAALASRSRRSREARRRARRSAAAACGARSVASGSSTTRTTPTRSRCGRARDGRGASRRRPLVAVLGDMLELAVSPRRPPGDRPRGRGRGADGWSASAAWRPSPWRPPARRGSPRRTTRTTFEDTVAYLLKRLVPGDTVLVKVRGGCAWSGSWTRSSAAWPENEGGGCFTTSSSAGQGPHLLQRLPLSHVQVLSWP